MKTTRLLDGVSIFNIEAIAMVVQDAIDIAKIKIKQNR